MHEPSQRVKDILAGMTLEEKAIQLSCIVPSMTLEKGVFKAEKGEVEMPQGVGRMTQFASGFLGGPKQAAEGANAIQKYNIEKTGLPVILQNESSSGLVAAEGTIFPVPVALASTFDANLSYEMGKVIGDEGKAIGAKVMMSPVADVSRDSRWGRVDETFGEDPLVAARFTSEEVRGIQGEDYTKRCSALAKHFVAYGASEVGVNCATINIGKKEIYEVYGTPFAAAIKENDMQGVMVTYSEIEGQPMSVNEEYTQKVLRQDMGFTGIAVCDGHSIPRVIETQGMYADRAELAGAALKAGIDSDTPTTTVYNHIVEGVQRGLIDEKDLDACVLRTLQQREEMGMLDNPYVDPEQAEAVFADPAADELSYEIAEKSIVLLKNNQVLPIKAGTKKVAVVGPFADSLSGFFGGYAYPAMMGSFLQMVVDPAISAKMEGFAEMAGKMFDIPTMKEKMYKDPSKPFAENFDNYLRETLGTVSLKEALEAELPDTQVVSHVGVKNVPEWKEQIAQAKAVAADADLIVLAVGEITGMGGDATSGEGVNNPDLTLPGHQQALVEAIHELGIPTVMVLYNGRAFALKDTEPLVDAIVEAWYPGPSGGKATAKVLSGAVNPGGHLPITFPQISSQCPLYYGHKTGSGYMTIRQTPDPTVLQPLYPFGYGLSYTTFAISNLVHDTSVETGGKFHVSVEVQNTGSVKGEDVVQIYTHSKQPTINRPIKELRGWKRVSLEPGEKKTLEFTFDTRQFGYFNSKNEFVIEPRPVEIFAGDDSSTIQARGEIAFTGEVKEILHDRVFNFEVVEK
jgi:beta-glucosidase